MDIRSDFEQRVDQYDQGQDVSVAVAKLDGDRGKPSSLPYPASKSLNQVRSQLVQVSGVMAPELIDYLAELGTYNVSVLCRPTSSTAGLPSGVEVFRSDFTYDSLVQVLRGKQLVVDMIAVMPIQDKMRLIDAIVDAGVERLIPGEFSSNMDNPVMRALWSVHADRITVRDYLKLKASQTPSFSWTAVAVGPFYEWVRRLG